MPEPVEIWTVPGFVEYETPRNDPPDRAGPPRSRPFPKTVPLSENPGVRECPLCTR